MLWRSSPHPLLWSAACFSLFYVNKASEQEAIGQKDLLRLQSQAFPTLNVSWLLLVSSTEHPDRRKLSLLCLFNIYESVDHGGATWGSKTCLEGTEGEAVPPVGNAEPSCSNSPSKSHPEVRHFATLPAHGLEEALWQLFQTFRQTVGYLFCLFWCFPECVIKQYRVKGAWVLLGQRLAMFMSLSSGPALAWAMRFGSLETPARICLSSGGWHVESSLIIVQNSQDFQRRRLYSLCESQTLQGIL